jgi:5,10-methylenetetrahydromethanopterin reductase
MPPWLSAAVEQYRKIYEQYEPADARWLAVHRGHLMFVRPEEKPFLSREMMEAFTFTGSEDVLRGRVEELRDAGYSQFTVQIVEGQEDALTDWAKLFGPLGLEKGGKKSAVKTPAKKAAKSRRR